MPEVEKKREEVMKERRRAENAQTTTGLLVWREGEISCGCELKKNPGKMRVGLSWQTFILPKYGYRLEDPPFGITASSLIGDLWAWHYLSIARSNRDMARMTKHQTKRYLGIQER